MDSWEPSRRLVPAIVLVGALILAAHAAGIVICPIRRITGIPCPGCGSTRAIMSLLHGELAAAVSTNPLAVALAVIVPSWWMFFRRRAWSRGAQAAILAVAVTATLLNWLWVLAFLPREAN